MATTACLIVSLLLFLGTGLASAQNFAPGVTLAVKDLKLSMTVPGRIEGLFIKEGDKVHKGQILLHLDRTLEELEVRRRRLILEDNSRLDDLRKKEQILAKQVRSIRTLQERGSVSDKQVEDEEISWRTTAAEIKQIEAAKRRERVDMELAQEAYERRHLRSPFNGIVTKVVLKEGESIAAYEPIVTLVDVSRVRFMGTVANINAGQLHLGNTVTIELGQENASLSRTAQVVFVSPVTDPASGLVEVIVEFDNPAEEVRPGITGRLVF